MPSQEDYLDNLLKDVGHEEQEAQPVQEAVPQSDENNENVGKNAERQAPDQEAASDMSEDEIEQLLSGGLDASRLENDQAEEENNELFHASDMDLSDEDVLKMLAESDDDDMQEIHSLQNKSDNHESVEDIAEEPGLEEERNALLGGADAAPSDDKQEKRAKAKKEREEAKKRRKEELAAKRAEKKAEKKVKKASKKEAAKQEQEEQDTAENLFDTDVLDSIVSKADKTGKEEDEVVSDNDVTGEKSEALPVDELAEVTPEETSGLDEIAPEENGTGGLGLDMGNLFGNSDAEDSLLNGLGGGDDSDLSDLLSMNDEPEDSDAQREEKREKKSEKKGFFTRLLDFFTEEEEEDEEQGNENLNLSDENKGIIKDLDKEGSKKKKNKKAKKAASEKTDKAKKKPEKKPKKQPKPKKEKPPKEITLVTDKKLSIKKVLPVVLVGVSVGVLLFVFINSAADYSDKREARAAYYAGDYQTCYLNLFGKDLDETESVMYGKSESILYIRLWIREFEMFAGEGDMVRALDSLIQTVDRYPQLYEYANQWNAGAEVAAGYATILNYLSANFGLTESQAQQIADEKKDIDYTRIVTAIANGKSFEEWNAPDAGMDEAPVEEVPESGMEDVLPEEEELGTDTFVDNQ